MEIVNIEKNTFENLIDRMEKFMDSIENMCDNGQKQTMSEWLDNQDVCMMLNICPRTLQTLRDKGVLPYSQINHKIFYKAEDVHRFVTAFGNEKVNIKK